MFTLSVVEHVKYSYFTISKWQVPVSGTADVCVPHHAVCLLICLLWPKSCVVCCHRSSRAAEMLLRAPVAPLLGQTWTGTSPLVMLPNVSIDGRETCWTPFPKEDRPKCSRSQDSIRIQDGGGDEHSAGVLLAGEHLMLWEWFGLGSTSMNYWRISDDGDDDAPSSPGQTQQMLSFTQWCFG